MRLAGRKVEPPAEVKLNGIEDPQGGWERTDLRSCWPPCEKNYVKTSTKVGFEHHPGAWPDGVRYYAHAIGRW